MHCNNTKQIISLLYRAFQLYPCATAKFNVEKAYVYKINIETIQSFYTEVPDDCKEEKKEKRKNKQTNKTDAQFVLCVCVLQFLAECCFKLKETTQSLAFYV